MAGFADLDDEPSAREARCLNGRFLGARARKTASDTLLNACGALQVAEVLFGPSLEDICSQCKVPQRTAAIIFMALANGAPDLAGAIAAISNRAYQPPVALAGSVLLRYGTVPSDAQHGGQALMGPCY